jgi:hypothetical protein
VALGPTTLFAALAAWVRERDRLLAFRRPHAAVCVPAVAQLVLLAGYQDIAYSPRYLLPALAGALALPSALSFERWLASHESSRRTAGVLTLLIAPVAVAAPMLRARERPLRAIVESLPARLANVPDDAIVVTGQPCPAIVLHRRIVLAAAGRRTSWQPVCPGWSWPRDLEAFLEETRWNSDAWHADHGRETPRTVVLDVRSDAWLGAGQQQSLADVRRYAERHRDRVANGTLVIWSQ